MCLVLLKGNKSLSQPEPWKFGHGLYLICCLQQEHKSEINECFKDSFGIYFPVCIFLNPNISQLLTVFIEGGHFSDIKGLILIFGKKKKLKN